MLAKKCQLQEGQLAKNEKDIEQLKEDFLQIQAKSMQDNLIFFNIAETIGENSNRIKDTLTDFFKNELKMPEKLSQEIVFDNVHRIGPKQKKARPIFVHFHTLRGKMLVLQHAKN